MFTLTNITKTPLGAWALIALMLATRAHSNHFGSPIALPDASLAVFFMAGLFFGGWRLFAVLLVEAALIDYMAITKMGVSDYCVSPAYVFLIPTYAALFLAGRIAARFKTLQPQDLLMQVGLLVGAATVAFLISNGSFYVLSGKFADLNWTQYATRVAKYYAPYLSGALVYSVVIVGLVKVLNAFNLAGVSRNKAL
ncbi:MAG: hypothetical protein HOP02_14460 [Methylococcaceae bacterium]|nr:hypothetical protein [Methylococcaceae bacterium]